MYQKDTVTNAYQVLEKALHVGETVRYLRLCEIMADFETGSISAKVCLDGQAVGVKLSALRSICY